MALMEAIRMNRVMILWDRSLGLAMASLRRCCTRVAAASQPPHAHTRLGACALLRTREVHSDGWNYSPADCAEKSPRCVFADETHCRLTDAEIRAAISASTADEAHHTEADRIVVKAAPFYYFPEA